VTVQVSVIIPVYNTAAFIRECLDAVLGQTLADIEVIVIDDGSTDGCAAILDGYAQADPRVTVIHSARNQGVSAARNRGIERSSGTYIGFVDSDDTIHPEMYRVLLETALTRRADIVKTTYRAKNGARCDPDMGRSGHQVRVLPGGVRAMREYLDDRITTICCDGLYARRLFNGIRFVEGRRHEDTQIVPRLLHEAGRVALVSGTFYFVRRWPGRFMASFTESRFDEIWARRELHRILSETEGYDQLRHRIDQKIASSIVRNLSAAYQSRAFPTLRDLCSALDQYITRDEILALTRNRRIRITHRMLLLGFLATPAMVILYGPLLRSWRRARNRSSARLPENSR
jgi:glycosyltransferase involved in cell wall biosynthesis